MPRLKLRNVKAMTENLTAGGETKPTAVQRHHKMESPVRAPLPDLEPLPGPGKVFIQELVDAQSGHAKRHRNIGDTPLSFAYYGNKLSGPGDVVSGIMAADRYSAGERFYALWRAREGCGRNIFERIGGSDHHWWSDPKADASEIVGRLRAKMYGKNFLIVQHFCGEGYSMAQAVRRAGIDSHPNGIIPRVREALDDLVTVMTGRRAQ